ncbi:serine esterase [Actinoplanes siamensis]|uniref:Serine esterase n=2 Tax=Actinoplanes siamensis TaxID=1223317 RepID=A0A919TPD5_9ACTN|nr:serine esterase [Actinoplanes siamensis]
MTPVVEEPGRPHSAPEENAAHGRLNVRPQPPLQPATRTGLVSVAGPDGDLQALILVPEPVTAGPYHLIVVFHGAGGSAQQGVGLLREHAAEHRLLLVAPQSSGATWDFIGGGFGPDVRRLDRVLAEVFAGYPVDRISVGGFSDGASYALTLGLANGDVFGDILAFSPGFAAPLVSHGEPRVFISHGAGDQVLPVDRCGRYLVEWLRQPGYDVTYEEFPGGHDVPAGIVARALDWLGKGEARHP